MSSRRTSLACLGLAAAVLVIYLATIETTGSHIDVYSANLASWRIAQSGAPWLEAVRHTIRPDIWDRLWIGTNPAGHAVVYRSAGEIAAALPAYLLSGLFTSSFSVIPASVTAAILTALTVLLLMASLRGLVGDLTVLGVGAVTALTTPYWTTAADRLWTHTLTDLSLAGVAWSCRRDRWWLLGAFGGVGLWARLHVALIVAVVGLGLAWSRRSPRIAVVVGAWGALFTAAVCVWTHWMYGVWSPTGGYGTPGQYASSVASTGLLDHVGNVAGLFVSPGRGLLVWTPVLVLLLPAVVRGWRGAPDWTRLLAVGGVAYLLVQGLIDKFHGGDGFFAYRLGLETLTCVVPVYAVTLGSAGRVARALLGPVLGVQLVVMAIGSTMMRFDVLKAHAWHQNTIWLMTRAYPSAWVVLGAGAVLGLVVAHLAPRLARTPQS